MPSFTCPGCGARFYLSPSTYKRRRNKEPHCTIECYRRHLKRSSILRKRLCDAQKKNMARPGIKKKIAEAARERYQDPVFREKMCKLMAKVQSRPEVRRKRSATLKKVFSHPVYKARMAKILKKVHNRPDVRKKHSQAMLGLYASGDRKPINSSYSEKGWFIGEKCTKFFYKSSWERIFAEILESSKLVKQFKYEPFGIPYKWCNELHTYFPDFWIKLRGGLELVVELKGRTTRGYKDRNKFKAAESYCKSKKIKFVTCFQMIDSLEAVTGMIQ